MALAIGLGALGCAPQEGDGSDETSDNVSESPSATSTNGLNSINGLTSLNGLNSINGLNSLNGLNSVNGLSSTTGLMTSSAGRTTVSYLVRCALPAGRSITKKDQNGASYTFPGALGLAPGWENGPTTQDDRYWISSCLMAHINTTGQHIPIYLVGVSPLGWGRSSSYPIQEGTFFGDLFVSPPQARYCGGRGFGSSVVAGRIGDNNQNGEPYTVITSGSGSTRCDDNCARDPSGDGYTGCAGIPGRAVTVWRQMVSTPALSFEGGTEGFAITGTVPGSVQQTSDSKLHGSRSLLVTLNASGAASGYAQVVNPAVVPGKNTTVFVRIPSGTNFGYVAAYVQDGPGKNYRFTSRGYNANQVIAGEWNSIVVPVPSDFDKNNSRMGVSITSPGAGTLKMYVDAISYSD